MADENDEIITVFSFGIDQNEKQFFRKQSNFDEVKPEQYSHDSQYSDLNEILQEALGRLPEKQRSVIMLRDYEGYSYQEISEITGLTESQVKVYIYRGRLFLKNYIGDPERVI